MIAPRRYQEKAIDELRKKANELLDLQGSKTIVFKAPTGSGKTYMMAEFLKTLVEYRPDAKTFSFIWTAPRQLHTQSKAKLTSYYHDSKALRCVDFEDLVDTQIGENEILFLNWESINKADNIYIRENERDFNLSHVIQNTLDSGRIIILVIDESHHSAKTETSLELIAMIQPKVTVEVSATPNIRGDESVTVHRERVIDEGMIKKRIAINPGFRNQIERQTAEELTVSSQAGESANQYILRMALDKRAELAGKQVAAGSNVNPLMLIQLPDARQGVADIKDEIVQILKDNHDITIENGKLAIYLSEDKENLANITRNDSKVEVMLFKQAIALGWDCPRAAILALFRDWRSFTFSTQTLGRILRMPELKHYDDDELNTGYVFTNLSDFSIQEEMAGDFLTIQHASRKEIYQSVALRSVYSRRFRELTRLAPQFITDFLDTAAEYGLKDKLDIEIDDARMNLIADGIIENADVQFLHIAEGKPENGFAANIIERIRTPMEAQRALDLFVRDNLAPFAPESRSIGRVKESIYRFFKHDFFMQFPHNGLKAQLIVLAPQNRQHFLNVLNVSKEKYQAGVIEREKELVVVEAWEVPTSYNYNHRYHSRAMQKAIFEPYYELENASQIEKDFAVFLDSTLPDVEWWFKNGDQDATFFAVPYDENGEQKTFYVDWIVKFTDGRIGLFDTKAGITAETAGTRAAGLAKYIAEQNQNEKNLFGGIVIFKNGSYWLNANAEYQYNENDLLDSGWIVLTA
jgi:type III restriction enzyme